MHTRTRTVQQVVATLATVFLVLATATATTVTATAVAMAGDDEAAAVQRVPQQLGRHNFLIGIAKVGARSESATSICGQELGAMLKAAVTKELWCLKVMDSFGGAPRTFSWGNYFWFAPKTLCEDLNTPWSISFSEQHQPAVAFNVTSPFPLRFTMVYLRFKTPYYIDLKLPFENLIHVGLCLPLSCAADDVMRYTDAFFQSGEFQMQRDFKLQMQAVDVKTPDFEWSLFGHTGCILFAILLIAIFGLPIVAEMVHRSKSNWRNKQPLRTKTTATAAPEIETEPISRLFTLLMCFRCDANYKCAFELERSDNFLTVIAGLRTIVCLWVTVFHVYYYSLYAMANAPLIFAKLEQFALQPMLQACFYVDLFFVMSAFLLVYNFLSNAEQVERIRRNGLGHNAKLFLKSVFHRYMRLTPVVIVTMLLSDVILDLLNMYSPFRLGVHSGVYCKNNWWYNLLYVHNFLDMEDICLSWTWYLACEMQFFVLFTALLFLYAKNARAAKIVFATLALGFVATGWMCNYRSAITFQIDVIYSTLSSLYVKPWVRISPYIGGAALGWLLHHQRQRQRLAAPEAGGGGSRTELRAVWRVAFWLLCVFLYTATNFMSYWRGAPSWLVAAIMSFGKLLFALCAGGVILLCARGRGGVLNAAMSARPFLFLNKYCFSVYVVTPTIVVGVFGLRNEPTNFSEVASTMDFLAVTVLAIASAFLLVILVEIPMQRVATALVRRTPRTPPNDEECRRRRQNKKATGAGSGNLNGAGA